MAAPNDEGQVFAAPSSQDQTQTYSADSATEAACTCKAMVTCTTCARWAGLFDTTRMRRAERLERLLDAAEQRGAVLTGSHLWMPQRGRWQPFRMDDLDVVEEMVGGASWA